MSSQPEEPKRHTGGVSFGGMTDPVPRRKTLVEIAHERAALRAGIEAFRHTPRGVFLGALGALDVARPDFAEALYRVRAFYNQGVCLGRASPRHIGLIIIALAPLHHLADAQIAIRALADVLVEECGNGL